jgi:TolB-like protein/DNA-binding winged helix-turn-helix (wHTH) protein/Flp pilus assembly protein TadD
MPGDNEPRTLIPFGPFEADLQSKELRKQGVRLRLPQQSFQILKMLLERPGELVTREELRQALWQSDTFVDFDHGLNAAINRLRETLGDVADNPHFIETLPRRGYRFIASMEGYREEHAAALTPASPSIGVLPVLAAKHTFPTEKELGHTIAEASPASRLGVLARHKAAVATAVCTLTLVLVAAFWFVRTKKPATIAHISPSIAVLPFADLSPEKDQEYFSDGLAEELLNSLAKIQGLHVAARTSAFQFKGKNEDLHVIGQKLNVATVLEGSVRKQGRRVRIGAQLVQVSDGYHLWSETYDRDLTDIFAVQQDIARSVAGSLRVALLGEKAGSLRGTSVEAYNAYLQGKYFYARGDRESIEKAIAYYEQAINLDPNYAPAWGALSSARGVQAGEFSGGSFYEGYNRAREAAERALSLDPSLAEGHAALGTIKRDFDWDWMGADACYERALALEPGNVEVMQGAAMLAAALNRFDQALRLDRRAVELDPLHASPYELLATHAEWAGRLDDAAAAARKALELNPEYPFLHTVLMQVYLARLRPQDALTEAKRETVPGMRLQALALAYHALGRTQESDRALSELITKYAGIAAFQIAEVYAFRGEAEQAFEWLERAYSERDPGLILVKGDALLRNLERDPRYAAFLKKMHLG